MTDDSAANKAKTLWLRTKTEFTGNWHIDLDDQAIIVNAFGAELAKAYAEIERFKTMSTVEMMCENLNVKHHVQEWERRCLKAEAEIPRLCTELAGIEQFAESWPCHCAENYPGATMYHGRDCQTAIAIEFVAQWRAAKVKP